MLSVASDLRSTERLSLAERTQELLAGPVVAGLQSLAAGKLAHGRPDEDAFVCGDDADAKALALELAAKAVAGRALDAGPLARARVARRPDRPDRQPQQALQGPRRDPRHRAAVTGPAVEVTDPQQRSRIAEAVLRDLPEWFGIEDSTRNYIEEAAALTTFAVEPDLGFLCLKQHTPHAAEIYVLGVRRDQHRRGVGRALVDAAEAGAAATAFAFFR